MRAADLLVMARQRAGLTQAQLARRSGYPRESIARWERGGREPSFSTVARVVRATDLDLVASLVQADDSLRDLTRDQVALTPEHRLTRFEDRALIAGVEPLARAQLPYVLVGDFAATLQGSAQRPSARMPTVISDDEGMLDAYLRNSGFAPVDNDSRWRAGDGISHWVGPGEVSVAIASAIRGTGGYPDLKRNAVQVSLGELVVTLAHPRDLLRIAEASPFESERARAPSLRALLEVLEDSEHD